MMQQRALQQSMRRLAAINPHSFARVSPITKLSAPAAIATSRHIQIRPAATQPTTPSDASALLASQRTHRPISPHLRIYRPQITWIASGLNRITGSILAGSFYVFGFAYLISPAFGWALDTASLAASFGGLPFAVQLLAKFGMALPFTFHGFNGLRHLMWDFGRQLKNQQVVRTGWTVVGVSVVSAAVLAFS